MCFFPKKISRKRLLKDFQFTAPMMFVALSSWVISSADRWIIAEFRGLKDVADYAAAYKFSFVYNVFVTSVLSATYGPRIYSTLRKTRSA